MTLVRPSPLFRLELGYNGVYSYNSNIGATCPHDLEGRTCDLDAHNARHDAWSTIQPTVNKSAPRLKKSPPLAPRLWSRFS